MKNISIVVAMLFVIGFAQSVSAATYQYITTSGSLGTVTANSVTDAFIFANNRAEHSGFILVSNTNGGGVNYIGDVMYVYVNADGFIVSVSADSSSEAFADTINKSMYSGVMLIDSTSDTALVGHRIEVVDNQ